MTPAATPASVAATHRRQLASLDSAPWPPIPTACRRSPQCRRLCTTSPSRLPPGSACAETASPTWSELEWRLAPAVAAMHGVSPLLAEGLRWHGPPHWAHFLAEQRRHTLLRQRRIEELLTSIDERSRSAGIAIVALKGAALQMAGVYAAGERPMADLDLLVRPADVETAVAVLLALSYRDAGTTWKHQGFDPPAGTEQRADLGEHADNPIKIDLHHRICERLPLTPDRPDGPRVPAACPTRPQRVSPRRRVDGASVGACGGHHDPPRLAVDSTLRHRTARPPHDRCGLGGPHAPARRRSAPLVGRTAAHARHALFS